MGASIVSTFVDSFTSLMSGLGTAIVDTFNTVFVAEGGGLSNLAIWGIVFGGVGLGIALVRGLTRKAG